MKPYLIAAFSALCISTTSMAASCVVSVQDFAFGSYNPNSPALDATSVLGVQCTASGAAPEDVSYTLSIAPGVSGDVQARYLQGPGDSIISYNLYSDANRSMVWGDTASNTAVMGNLMPPQTSSNDHIVFGRIPGNQQGRSAGEYADNLMILLDY